MAVRLAPLVCAVTLASPAILARGPTAAPSVPIQGKVDELVFARLKRLGIAPAPISTDATFLRRVYLDAIGTLPTVDETRAFLADRNPRKRAALVDGLLAREEFADYWAMKWSDLLRVKSEYPINLWPNAVQAYHRWIRTSVRDGMPYDRFARELLTESGSNFRVPQVNFYRAVQSREPEAIARAVALTFMGTRAEKWPKARLADMAAFFSQIGYKPTQEWKEEIVFFAPSASVGEAGYGATRQTARKAILPDGSALELAPDQDPREAFAAWLTSPGNPWFARSLANRVWSWLMGRGIVHEPDDIRPDNPPSNPELLAFLEQELVRSRFDPKHLFRLILTSSVYQLDSVGPSESLEADANFSHYLARPLDAEVLIDALNQIAGTNEPYSSAIPEPYTFTPIGQRAVALSDGSITSPFLETFGRPSRDTGLESERRTTPTAAERLTLMNSSEIQRKLDQSPLLRSLVQARGDVRQTVTSLYLTMLSRPPSRDEIDLALGYLGRANGNRRAALLDVSWALVNSREFLYRH